jgi:carboxylesterase type B
MESEDCLFLNVQSPANASNLPVLIWIHGGGYGAGNGRQDFSDLLNTNGNNFVVVSIQYRLGPYGFLASDELNRRGVVNAGLLDQVFALQWVQTYIRYFGGNPSAVTISGESAGGGSVMLMDMGKHNRATDRNCHEPHLTHTQPTAEP